MIAIHFTIEDHTLHGHFDYDNHIWDVTICNHAIGANHHDKWTIEQFSAVMALTGINDDTMLADALYKRVEDINWGTDNKFRLIP